MKESMFHWLLLAEGAIALFTALMYLPSKALVSCLMAVWILHQLTTWLELRYVIAQRLISPIEQMLHSFLEVIPFALVLIVGVVAMIQEPPGLVTGWSFIRRDLSQSAMAEISIWVALVFCFILVPFVEESNRCFRQLRRGAR